MHDQSTIDVSVYALVDPQTDEVRYVGQTAYPLRVRLAGHVSAAIKGHGRKDAWIRSLTAQGLRPHIKVLQVAAAPQANEVEEGFIAQLREAGHDLTNGEAAGRVSGRTRLYLDWVMIAVRVSPQMDEQIRGLAAAQHGTLTYTARMLLEEALAARAATGPAAPAAEQASP